MTTKESEYDYMNDPSLAVRETTMMPRLKADGIAGLAGLDYTSENEIRARVTRLAKKPTRTLTQKQLEALGLDELPMLQEQVDKPGPSLEQKLEMAEKWAQSLIETTRKQGRLMTDRQLADWATTRSLKPGDVCRYLGPTREEVIESIPCIVPRPQFQEGVISRVETDKMGKLFTFSPRDPVEPVGTSEPIPPQRIELVVREHTRGWLMLERIG